MILLDHEQCRGLEEQIAGNRQAVDDFMRACTWVICPECLWLSAWYPVRGTSAWCTRPAGERIRYGGGAFVSPSTCKGRWPSSDPVVVPPKIGDAIWSSLLIGGTNAVVELVSTMAPEQFGLPSSVAKYRERRHA